MWLLVERGDVDINVKDDEGMTPFSCAAHGGDETVYPYLSLALISTSPLATSSRITLC